MHYFAKLSPYVLFFSLSIVGHVVYAQGPYRGRVIDKDTKQPLEDAAVLTVWWKRAPGLAHPIITYHDAHETLTDLGGNFTIPGTVNPPTDPNAKIDEPLFYIFKPGYEAYGGGNLRPPSTPKPIRENYKLPEQVYEKDGRMVVELGRLTTKEERLKNVRKIFIPSDVPEVKRSNLIRLRNMEEDSLGLPPRRPRKGSQQ